MLSRMAERDHQSLALSPPEFPYMRNWCVIGALNRDLGIVPGQIDTFGIPPGEYYASARSQSCLRDPTFRYRPRPNENCLFRIRWASSMPTKVIAAVRKDLRPPIETHRRLMELVH